MGYIDITHFLFILLGIKNRNDQRFLFTTMKISKRAHDVHRLFGLAIIFAGSLLTNQPLMPS